MVKLKATTIKTPPPKNNIGAKTALLIDHPPIPLNWRLADFSDDDT
jgi:hypothetical protein